MRYCRSCNCSKFGVGMTDFGILLQHITPSMPLDTDFYLQDLKVLGLGVVEGDFGI